VSAELDAFKRELSEAGQPWSRWGARCVGVGLVGWLIVQVSWAAGGAALWLNNLIPNAFYVLGGLGVAVIAVGWALFIVAFVKRRNWSKTHAFEPPSLTNGAA
jgi:hypothetical protein